MGISSKNPTRATISSATAHDLCDIRNIYLRAFPKVENQLVATLAVELLNEESDPETISLVAKIDGALVGHVALSPVFSEANQNHLGYILAPLAVSPDYQNCGVGSKLVECGIARISKKGRQAVFVYGDPDYYGRFGFCTDAAANFLPPYELQYPFGWQAILTGENISDVHFERISCVASLLDSRLW